MKQKISDLKEEAETSLDEAKKKVVVAERVTEVVKTLTADMTDGAIDAMSITLQNVAIKVDKLKQRAKLMTKEANDIGSFKISFFVN